jgi:hypothetical protein
VSLWQYRYTASAMSHRKENSSAMVLLLFFVADDTVESLISFTDHIKKEVMELKAANHRLQPVPIILASKQLQNTFSKQGAYLKPI